VCHLLAARAREQPERPVLSVAGTTLSAGDLHDASGRLAAALLGRGVSPGDRVGLVLEDRLAFALAWFALARAGATAVPIDPRARAADLGHIVADASLVAVLADAPAVPTLERLRAAAPSLRWIGSFDGGAGVDLRAALGAEAQPAPLEALDPDAIVSVQYTSGTTGLPKGCLLDHGYWLHFAATCRDVTSLGPEDVALTAQPFHYVDPLWNLLMCLIAGAPLVALPRFSASTFWRSVGESGATFFYCLGTMPLYLLRQPPDATVDRGHRVRLVLCSGIAPGEHRAMEQRWGVPWREAYGSTELGAVLVVPPEDERSVGSGSMGRPVGGREVRVTDPEGKDVADGTPGEMRVRGPGFMRGYLGQPEATVAWRGEDGWAHTGDLVVRDTRGGLRLVGRLKEMIRRGGENIAAAEVEAVLMRHPLVQLAACVAEPDPLRGEEVKAFVQLVPSASPATVPPSAIVRHAREWLAPHKAPRYLVYADAMPLTPSERVNKPELQRLAAASGWPVHDTAGEDST
jgi:crotonobetaine/carnitine-CoA ligase